MSVLLTICKTILVAYLISSIIPLIRWDAWFIRVWDFPRLQFLIIGIIFCGLYLALNKDSFLWKIVFLSVALIGIGLDAYRILPYSKLWKEESLINDRPDEERSISIISVNVLQDNQHAELLLKLISEKKPDVVFLLEVNQRWLDDLSTLEADYPHKIKRPLENTYGLALYSKLPLIDPEIRFLVEDDIPSVFTKIRLRSGDTIDVYGLHPRPPHYKTGDTTERDGELVQVAKAVRKTRKPVIVVGDLNDVAWSHTTRLFRRISGLLDPRVGRGAFPTFPVHVALIRFPLDYIFYSSDWTLNELDRLPDIKSDHFPMYISLNLEPKAEKLQTGPEIEEGDIEEANKTINRARNQSDEEGN